MLIDSCVLGFERNGESHVPQKTLKPSNPVFLLGLTGVLYPFSCKSQGLSQLLEYEKSMRTTAFLPFIPYKK